jgi:hypothetical protein
MKKNSIEETILELLLLRGGEKTICPSEVARMLFPLDWEEHMEGVRKVAESLMDDQVIEITQKGRRVEKNYQGPIRLRLRK